MCGMLLTACRMPHPSAAPLASPQLSADELSGSDSEGSEGGGEDEEGLTQLERRRRDRAAGDHPLQAAFRQASAKLLKRHWHDAGGAYGLVCS